MTPPSKYPASLGNISGGGMASASFTVQFHCRGRDDDHSGEDHDLARSKQERDDTPRFILWAPWSANVYEKGTLVAKDLEP